MGHHRCVLPPTVAAILVGLHLGCASPSRNTTADKTPPPPSPPEEVARSNASPADAAAPSSERKRRRLCLPVVARACNCVYSCGVGEQQDDGTFLVAHEHWRGVELRAGVAPWCVGSACTDAFHVEVVCGGVCAPRPADATCHFDGDVCTSRNRGP